MPEICRFSGIVIRMYFDDHEPPHFHAFYGGQEALVQITAVAVLAGDPHHVCWRWLWSGRLDILRC